MSDNDFEDIEHRDNGQSGDEERGNEHSDNEHGDDGEAELEHNPILVYECSQRYVGIHYDDDPDNDIVWQSIGESVEEAVDDMVETLNYLPAQLAEIEAGEADLVDVIPLKQGEDDE